ncbi:MAG: hypothetical protein ACREDY_20430 [Bradyrhizobium sp.]
MNPELRQLSHDRRRRETLRRICCGRLWMPAPATFPDQRPERETMPPLRLPMAEIARVAA